MTTDPGYRSPIDYAALRALPYEERQPRMLFPGDPDFVACTMCVEVQTGRSDYTASVHRCFRANGECICGCLERAAA